MNVEPRTGLTQATVITMRELNQQTSATMDRINAGGRSVVVKKHGRMIAIITPIVQHGVESNVLTSNKAVRELMEAEQRRAESGRVSSMTLAEAEAWLGDQD